VTIKGDKDIDFKIEKLACGAYVVTDVETGKSQKFAAKDFNFDYNALLRFNLDGEEKLLQFNDVKTEINYSFYYKGNTVEAQVYDATQFKLKKFMAPPKKVDYAKSVLSPMPGGIVNVAVEVGQVVVDGQELFTIEAMKMQNMIKSQVDGKIKKIHIKAGDSVAVDQVLIEYE
jgi:propionyl-CoA carboxylase alpha chain